MDAKQLRARYIEFFLKKGHELYPSAPLVPIDVTGKLDETLLFTGAGMVQFKPFFRGIAKPPNPRLVTSQKCMRAVDIEEVGNPAHLTFFEMLGNFSFGDYFKKEAISWAWEFLTGEEWLNLNKDKLCVTVFEDDDEAYEIWAEIWKAEGFEPRDRIHRLGEDKNFWPGGALSSGPPGPCGPCSEIFYLVADKKELEGDFKKDEAAGKWLEIWNLVFMQYEWKGKLKDTEKPHLGFEKQSMDPLPKPCVDTGMGLERTASVLSGFPSVYETDVFSPIVQKVCEIASYKMGTDEQRDRAVRIISDHIRSASMCIADGILPSNTGRGYVLRRLLRRSIVVAKRTLGIEKQFLHELFPCVISSLADPFSELKDRESLVTNTLQQEEINFRHTMEEGIQKFFSLLEQSKSSKKFSGENAFFLYDTFGFPYELTKELAKEHQLEVDDDEFYQCMKQAQQRSRSAQGSGDVFGGVNEELVLSVSQDAKPYSVFVGYDTLTHMTRIIQISPRFDEYGKTTGHFQICLEESPFYAEAGGQVGDTGWIRNENFLFRVTDTWKKLDLIWCDAELISLSNNQNTSKTLKGLTKEEIVNVLNSGVFFKPVSAEVDEQRRKDIVRNHTATHLLHSALRRNLGNHVTQAGSLVAPDRLRFDFTHGKQLSQEELEKIETEINEKVAEAIPVIIHDNVPLSEARKIGAMMLFGEKYGDKVRMIQIDEYSLELCGGTHVSNTSEIGTFKITSESSSASGVRRIEAVTGRGAYQWMKQREEILKETATLLKTNPNDIKNAVEKLQIQLKELKKTKLAQAQQAQTDKIESQKINGINLYIQKQTNSDPETAKLLTDQIIEKDQNGVAIVATSEEGKVMFFCKIGKNALEKGIHAGRLAGELARKVGGGGGGSPAFAQAGGKDNSKLDDALAEAPQVIAQLLK